MSQPTCQEMTQPFGLISPLMCELDAGHEFPHMTSDPDTEAHLMWGLSEKENKQDTEILFPVTGNNPISKEYSHAVLELYHAFGECLNLHDEEKHPDEKNPSVCLQEVINLLATLWRNLNMPEEALRWLKEAINTPLLNDEKEIKP